MGIEPLATWSNATLIAFRGSHITLSSIGFDLGFRTLISARRSILVDFARKRFDTWPIQVGVQTLDFSLTLCLLRVRETVGKPTQALVHIANQQNSCYGHQHDDE